MDSVSRAIGLTENGNPLLRLVPPPAADTDVAPFLFLPHRPGLSVGGSVLAVLAQSGYAREAVLCVPTCRTAALVGRDAEGGLPELWGALARRAGGRAATGGPGGGRLAAVARGGNAQRALALVRDHGPHPSAELAAALRAAVANGHLAVVELLAEHGADLRADGDFAVRAAARNGHAELVSLLVSRGADAAACAGPSLRLAAEGGHLGVVELLVALGVGSRADCEFLLGFAAEGGHVPLARRLLLDRGVSVHLDGDAALRSAARRGHADMVAFLVDRGANIHSNAEGALWAAAEHGHLGIVKLLAARGAKVRAASGIVRTAAQRGHAEVADFLASRGADRLAERGPPCEPARVGRIPAVVFKSNA